MPGMRVETMRRVTRKYILTAINHGACYDSHIVVVKGIISE